MQEVRYRSKSKTKKYKRTNSVSISKKKNALKNSDLDDIFKLNPFEAVGEIKETIDNIKLHGSVKAKRKKKVDMLFTFRRNDEKRSD